MYHYIFVLLHFLINTSDGALEEGGNIKSLAWIDGAIL